MKKTCGKCGGSLEGGFTTALGLVFGAQREGEESRLIFVVPGTHTSPNPIRAFQQGLADESSQKSYRISGYRCSACGALDLYADEEIQF